MAQKKNGKKSGASLDSLSPAEVFSLFVNGLLPEVIEDVSILAVSEVPERPMADVVADEMERLSREVITDTDGFTNTFALVGLTVLAKVLILSAPPNDRNNHLKSVLARLKDVLREPLPI